MNPKEDRLFRASLIALLVLYAVGGNLIQLFGSIGFPSVDVNFVTVNSIDEFSHYELKFTALNNEELPEPIYFADANAWIDKAQSNGAKRLIDKICLAAYAGDIDAVDLLRSELELLYFDELVSAEYELVLRSVNPIGNYTEESSIVEQTLEKFRFSRALASHSSTLVLAD